MIGLVNGLFAPPVIRLYPTYEDLFFETPGTYTFTVPKGAKSIDVTVIGSGGGGNEGGVSYGNIANAYPGGAGAGAAGEMTHAFGVIVMPGASYAVTVGKAGAAYGGAGEKSSFGTIAQANGGNGGNRGGHEPLNNTSTANGGKGGSGGIGGNGGGKGRGQYSNLIGADGADGESTMDWANWEIADWYVFRDISTGKRLGQGGRGGDGMGINDYSDRAAWGLTVDEAPGQMYGSGGRGGDQQKTGPVKTPEAGGNGLVAVRVWYKTR